MSVTITITDHPQFAALSEAVPREQMQGFPLADCPGCGKKLKKAGGYVTLTEQHRLIMGVVCPQCARRIQQSPTQREKIMEAIGQTARLVVDTGGNA